MSAPIEHGGRCPTCGNPTPAGARFCPNCGTPLSAAPAGDEWFRDAIDDVVADDAATAAGAPPAGVPDAVPTTGQAWGTGAPPATESPRQEPAWTATSGEWSSPPPVVVAAEEPTGWRRNRTLWIILGIVGFVLLCCCGSMMLVSAVSSVDSAFQDEISLALATLPRC